MLAGNQIAALIRQICLEAGFDSSGVAAVRAEDVPELTYFKQWIEQGRAGEMEYLKQRDQHGRLKRASLERAVPWARSVIVVAKNYNAPQAYSTEATEPGRGWISRYAWTADYHDSMLASLRQVEARLREAVVAEHPDFRSWCYVDTGPLVERVYAKYAGIGWVGKNTCIIDQKLGSWLFLGVMLTSLELQPDLPAPDRCGTCTRCMDACPTQAITAPYQLDSRMCIAYLTIEKRGAIPEEMREGMGRNIFGCDICQDVCPWNQDSPRAENPAVREELVDPALEWIAAMSEEDFRQAFRGTPVKRAKSSGLRRNVAVAMGNSGERRFVPALEKMAADADAVVAEHARWALDAIAKKNQIRT
jgi:epoxyqueuosine reductase